MSEIRIDFETRSDVDITGKKTGPKGSGRYFESAHFRPLLLSIQDAGGQIHRWRWGEPCPDVIRRHTGVFRAFNAAFERRCLLWLHQRCGWPYFGPERFRCTAAEAAAMALPRSLEAVAEALGLSVNKDKRGKALIQRFSVPRKARLDEQESRAYFNAPEDFPTEFDEFAAYCDQDVAVESAVAARLIPLSDYEQRVYVMDQVINDRGIRIDRRSCVAAIALKARALERLDAEIREATGGAVRRCSDAARLVAWVQAQGVALDTAQKADLAELLELDDLPPHVRRALELRQEGGKTSASKFQAFLDYASPADDRVRHIYVYHAASTGRWQARGVNNYNLPRPRAEFDDAHLNPETLFRTIRTGLPEMLDAFYGRPLGRPLHLLSDAIRGFEWAAPGKEFVQADYSGIESVVIAWTAGEEWKLQAMREINADPDNAPDMYRRTAAWIVNSTTDIITRKHPLRQNLGKIAELALGFQGGCSALASMARNFNVKLQPLYAPIAASTDPALLEKSWRKHANALKRRAYKADVLHPEAWVVCEIIKTKWRTQNAAIAAGWRAREEAIREAVRNPGVVTQALMMRYVVKMGFLVVQLPSGRCLFYAAPRLRSQVWAELRCEDGTFADAEPMDREQAERLTLVGKVRIKGDTSPSISALGVDKSGKKMQREPLHGGIVAENDTQAIARDLLVHGMFLAEDAGYPIVGTTYDEILAEVPRGWGDVAAFERLICELPSWAEGLPLIAGGFRAKRYAKK